jgi:hypothetical protein
LNTNFFSKMNTKTISIKELEELYRSNKNKIVADMLGVSVPTLIKYITNSNIPLKQKGNRDNSDKFGRTKVSII